ncbi:hypothetical protein B0T13DRAFT_533119, partial [Neurospora crassa]
MLPTITTTIYRNLTIRSHFTLLVCLYPYHSAPNNIYLSLPAIGPILGVYNSPFSPTLSVVRWCNGQHYPTWRVVVFHFSSRLYGSVEVTGSNPVRATFFFSVPFFFSFFFFFPPFLFFFF